jgi:hypothetical protein
MTNSPLTTATRIRIEHDDPRCAPIQALIAKKTGIPAKDIDCRPIICTASIARYGECSHWIISVEGSPPRGTILYDTEGYTPGEAFIVCQTTCKKLTGRSYDIVQRFVEACLAE